GRVHPRFLTPDVSTLAMGAVSIVWTVFIIKASQNVLFDSITALGFQIAFYYGFTGFACAVFYRRELTRSARNFFMAGFLPALGGAIMTAIFVKAFFDNKDPSSAYSGGFLGVGTAVAIGVGLILLGIVVMIIANVAHRDFFRRKTEVSDPGFLEGTATGKASVMAD